MALSDRRITDELRAGAIVIDPFNVKNLGTSSYDVTLGEFYFREHQPEILQNVYNMYSKRHTDAVWGTEPEKAQRADRILPAGFNYENFDPDDLVILVKPGESILAHTQEYIGGRDHITTMMKARSSMGRNFIEVAKCAGWGDVGYTTRWTMEITNNAEHYTIPLVVGRRIAQIVFFETGSILNEGYEVYGKYQGDRDIEKIKAKWRPQDMLPKLYLDRDIKKK